MPVPVKDFVEIAWWVVISISGYSSDEGAAVSSRDPSIYDVDR